MTTLLLEVQFKCHFIQDPTVSAPELSPLCTEQRGQWCLHVVTGCNGLEQRHRKKDSSFSGKVDLMLRYSSPETLVQVT